MIRRLLKFASELKNEKEKNKFTIRINKIAEDLASKDSLLIDINDMSSIFDSTKIEVKDIDEEVNKMILEP